MLTPITKPEKFLSWAEPPPDESELNLEDPIALDYLGGQIGLWLLPSFTTRTSRAQYVPMVLYGLHLAREVAAERGWGQDDERLTRLFERWERFWALASMESRKGAIEPGHVDAMRGVRGARRVWKEGESPLPLEFKLISRQSELGALGAYVVPLRSLGLLSPGGLSPTNAAQALIDDFWGPTNRAQAHESFAVTCMAPEVTKTKRELGSSVLAKLGEASRLSAIRGPKRAHQREFVHDRFIVGAKGPTSSVAGMFVRFAAQGGLRKDGWAPSFLDAAFDGALGPVEPELRATLDLARAFSALWMAVLAAFNATYERLVRRGWRSDASDVATSMDAAVPLDSLRAAAQRFREREAAPRLHELPVHGSRFLCLVDELATATSSVAAMNAVLDLHDDIQVARQHGAGWVQRSGDVMILRRTSYTGRADNVGTPVFKLPALRAMLEDLGRIATSEEVEA